MLAAAPSDVSAAQEQRLQLVGYVSSAASLIGVSYVLVHLLYQQWLACGANKARGRAGRAQMDFSGKLVLVLSLFDLATVVARVAGREPIDNGVLCNLQAAVLQAASLGSCTWVCCIAFNLYRWLVAGESVAARQARFRLYLAIATVPSVGLVAYHLSMHKYGDATFYCWLSEIQLMFLTFYIFYVAMVVFNFVLLVLIHVNMKQRVARHDTIEADTSSMLIRRKLLLYIVVFIAHRSPMMIYRLAEALGNHHIDIGLFAQVIQDLNGLSNSIVYGGLCRKQAAGSATPYTDRLEEIESVSSPVESQQRPSFVLPRKKRVLMPSEDEGRESIVLRSASTGSFRLTSSDSAAAVTAAMATTSHSSTPITALAKLEAGVGGAGSQPSSENGDFTTFGADRPLYPMPLYLQVQKCHQSQLLPDSQQQQLMTYKQRWKNHFAKVKGVAEATQTAATAPVAPTLRHSSTPLAAKIGIFASTFNMGEKDVDEAQLPTWIPIGYDIYVVGVQECMDLGDLQSKILQHLAVISGVKYVHYSCEIGKRATALGYHGYIALTIFVRESAVISGRFKMPSRPSGGSKSAQEVFRGKSLLVFGRASNKGAVGMSFRYDDTSFAFVTCHLASDSSSSGKKKKQQRGGGSGGTGRRRTRTDESMNASIDSDAEDDGVMPSRLEQQGNYYPPSKMHRRNQDAMEILQQLYLDEEDHGFGFPHLHHHSFILGDFNYRMTRQGATPTEMLESLVAIGAQDLRNRRSLSPGRSELDYKPMVSSLPMLPAPSSPAMLQRASDQSPTSSTSFQEFMTPRTDHRNSGISLASSVEVDFGSTSLHIAESSGDDGGDEQETAARSAERVAGAFKALLQDHDELCQLRLSNQIFFGFKEHDIAFFPTFRRIRGQSIDNPRDPAALEANYSLTASHGGFRVPSYTDRVLFASLEGMESHIECESYTSCEQVTTSDHKPVAAAFRVRLPRTSASAQHFVTEDYAWNANSSGANPNILQSSRFARTFLTGGRMRDVPGTCELRLRIEFRSIRWVDAIDSAAFDRAEHVQFGFLFPLPSEDVFAQQRKLHEVAEHLTWGEHLGGGASASSGGNSSSNAFDEFASTVTPTSNFHVIKWNDFVERGLRYHTMSAAAGTKHVAVMLRAPSSRCGRSLSKGTSVPRLRVGGQGGGQGSGSHSSSISSSVTALSPTPSTPSDGTPGASLSSSSASTLSISTPSTAVGASLDQLFGHGTFSVDASGAKREVVVPLTIGGRLLGRLQLRVALKMRQPRAKGA